MTTLNAALNFGFASSEAARIAQAERGAQDAIAAQLNSAAAASPFVVGTTITARYQYKVAEDGSLLPTQTQITTNIPEDGAQADANRRAGRNLQRNDRRASFADLARPRATLSPSEELAVFGALSRAGQSAQQAEAQLPIAYSAANTPAQVTDESGQAVEAEVLTFRRENSDELRKARNQYNVATLYARNNDVVYNVSPISQLAA